MKQGKFAKRILATSVLFALFVSLLSSCGSEATSATDTDTGTSQQTSSTTYQVTLNPNGGTFADGTTETITIDVAEGDAIDFETYSLTKEGDTHIGWYYEDGSPWPGARKVTEDVFLVAKWTETVESIVYPLALFDETGSEVTMTYENGVYQFSVVSSIYGGYAQRSGTYTLYIDELQAAIDTDDGTTGRVLAVASSNYTDATGTLYAEFYNDGTYDLYYDYTNAGENTKYCMETGTWTLEGYTPPIEPAEIPENGSSRHIDWDTSLLEGDGSLTEAEGDSAESDVTEEDSEETAEDISDETSEQDSETEADAAEFVTLPGSVAYIVAAENSDTMELRFCGNGVLAVYMSTYQVNVDATYLWSYDDENGLTITHGGNEENVATVDEDTCTLSDDYGNTYSFSVADLVAATPELEPDYIANATNSETMLAYFYANGKLCIMFDMTAYGAPGQYYAISSGQWTVSDEDSLQIALNGALLELTEIDGGYEFTVDGNTYLIDTARLPALAE